MKNKSIWILIIIACISYITATCVSDNLDKIYATLGDYYLRKNDIEHSYGYYEKAFALGFEGLEQRDAYVNSIINTPLTTDNQEKLVKFIEIPVDDSARLKAQYFLADLKKEIHRKYPYNYITNAVHNQKILRWGNIPIKYSFVISESVPKYFIREIENALTEWEKVTDNEILFEEDNEHPNIIIRFKQNNSVNDNSQKYVVAYTTPTINLARLKNMEIVFYLQNNEGEIFTPNQVYNTALHEIVHALGFMGHSNNKDNIMYLTKDSISLANDARENLLEADINTVKLLYKIKPQISNVDNVNAEYISSLVLGNEVDVNKEKLKEAKTYIRKAPNLPAGYIDLAEGFVINRDYIKAIKALKKALQLADNDEMRGMIYYNLAITYYYTEDFDKAMNYLDASRKIKDIDEKQYLLGEIYIKQGEFDKAIDELNSLIAKNPNNIEYTIALANIYVNKKDYLKAREVLKKYLKNNPNQKNNSRLKAYGILNLGL